MQKMRGESKKRFTVCKKCGADVETGNVPLAHVIGVVAKKQIKHRRIFVIAVIGIIIIIGIGVFFLVTKITHQ